MKYSLMFFYIFILLNTAYAVKSKKLVELKINFDEIESFTKMQYKWARMYSIDFDRPIIQTIFTKKSKDIGCQKKVFLLGKNPSIDTFIVRNIAKNISNYKRKLCSLTLEFYSAPIPKTINNYLNEKNFLRLKKIYSILRKDKYEKVYFLDPSLQKYDKYLKFISKNEIFDLAQEIIKYAEKKYISKILIIEGNDKEFSQYISKPINKKMIKTLNVSESTKQQIESIISKVKSKVGSRFFKEKEEIIKIVRKQIQGSKIKVHGVLIASPYISMLLSPEITKLNEKILDVKFIDISKLYITSITKSLISLKK